MNWKKVLSAVGAAGVSAALLAGAHALGATPGHLAALAPLLVAAAHYVDAYGSASGATAA